MMNNTVHMLVNGHGMKCFLSINRDNRDTNDLFYKLSLTRAYHKYTHLQTKSD